MTRPLHETDPSSEPGPLMAVTSMGRLMAVPAMSASDALRLVTAARTAVDKDVRAWKALSRTTDFADGAQL
ncbi:hypothetical protein RGQ21_21000 [Kitasatospora aureofaciens]|nr:hypothetical protein RGQ21_21000 [Kitasatospora aureofaciens]